MAYKTDGSSHFNGIELEEEIVNFIKKSYDNGRDVLNIYKDIRKKLGSVGKVMCVHKGGTNNKNDAIVVCANANDKGYEVFTISIKRKKYENGKPKGTFDVINTTIEKFNNEYNVFDNNVIKEAQNWLESKKSIIKNKDDIEHLRDDFEDICDRILNTASGGADKFAELTKNEFFKTDILIIGKTAEAFGKEVLTHVCVAREKNISIFNEGNKYFLAKGNGKSSRRLMAKDIYGNEFKTPFRVRVVLNNGLSAYYGLSDANSTSVLTVKIQVDDVQYIIDQMECFRLD